MRQIGATVGLATLGLALALSRCGGSADSDTSVRSGSTDASASAGSGGNATTAASTGAAVAVGSGGAPGSGGSSAGGTGGAGDGGGGSAVCTKTVHLHMSNFSWVNPLTNPVSGVGMNGCWTYEARDDGFWCNYDPTQSDYIKTGGSGAYASYNEIKSLNLHDAKAVSNCQQQSGGKPVRTYVVWNGASWDDEGISASVTFAEVYATQADRASKLPIWSGMTASYKAVYRPMINLSPETASDAYDTYSSVKQICDASKDGAWVGIYFYDGQNSGGQGMADWKRQQIVEAMNYCTTH